MKQQANTRRSRADVTSPFKSAVGIKLFVYVSLLVCVTRYSSHYHTEATSSIPRSNNARSIDPNRHTSSSLSSSSSSSSSSDNGPTEQSSLPPWNPSPQIDADGFLTESYSRIEGEWESEANIGGRHRGLEEPVRIRQVPGDGNCLFHSITVAMAGTVNSTHIDMAGRKHTDEYGDYEDGELYEAECDVAFDLNHLHYHSTLLRQKAVNMLSLNPRRLLFLQGNEYLRARDLVDAAAAQYDLNGDEYCDLMRKDSYWGGGPEIVALCNVLRRPIHVYELSASHHPAQPHDTQQQQDSDLVTLHNDPNKNTFRLRRMACFGSPKFDRRQPLHILSADSRFPDLSPGEQLPSGNHFLALFPHHCIRSIEEATKRRHVRGLKKRNRRRTAGVRGGGAYSSVLPAEERREDVLDGGRHRRRRKRGDGSYESRKRDTDMDDGGENDMQPWDTDGKHGRRDYHKRRTLWGAVTSFVRPIHQDSDGPLRSLFQFAIRLFLRV